MRRSGLSAVVWTDKRAVVHVSDTAEQMVPHHSDAAGAAAAFAAAICRRLPLVGRLTPWEWALRLPLVVRLSPRPIVTCEHKQHAHSSAAYERALTEHNAAPGTPEEQGEQRAKRSVRRTQSRGTPGRPTSPA